MKNNLPSSIRKHIRNEKARIRKEVFGLNEQKEQISAVLKKIIRQ